MPLILAPGDYTRWLGDEPDPRDLIAAVSGRAHAVICAPPDTTFSCCVAQIYGSYAGTADVPPAQ